MAPQDPMELFDLVDAEGRGLGVRKPRGLVHRDGDWHQSVHLWVVLEGQGAPAVVLQRRGLEKDTHPGLVDVSVAGHLRAGESPRDGLREAEEEIGLVVHPDDCVQLGVRRSEHRSRGILDREIQHVFLLRSWERFEALRPDSVEVAGVLCASFEGLYDLLEGRLERLPVREYGSPGDRMSVLTREALVPTPDGYFSRALQSIAQHRAGAYEPCWRIG